MKNNILKIIVFCLINLSNLTGFAQLGISDNFAQSSAKTIGDDTEGEDLESTTIDEAAFPIDDYLLPMLLIGIHLGFRLLKKNQKLRNKPMGTYE